MVSFGAALDLPPPLSLAVRVWLAGLMPALPDARELYAVRATLVSGVRSLTVL